MSGKGNWKKECNSFSRCFQAANWLITVWEPCFKVSSKNWRVLPINKKGYLPTGVVCIIQLSKNVWIIIQTYCNFTNEKPTGPWGPHFTECGNLDRVTAPSLHPRLNCFSSKRHFIFPFWYIFYIVTVVIFI